MLTGLRFVLQKPAEGKRGYLIWKDDQLAARIDWNDPVVKYGLDHRIKYVRLVQRKASSPQAKAADVQGYRYFVQGVAETVWAKRWTASPRDVCSTLEAHRCKHGRHPDRNSHAHDETLAVLSWLREMPEKAVSAALASVRLWRRSRAEGPVCRISGGLS